MSTNRIHFDADKLIRNIYNKIAVWHNNDERLDDAELGHELRFLAEEIAEDVLKSVHGDEISISLDKHKLGMTKEEIEGDAIEREKRRNDLKAKIQEEAKKHPGPTPS